MNDFRENYFKARDIVAQELNGVATFNRTLS